MPNYVEKECHHCGKKYQALYKQRNSRKFCSRECVNLSQSGSGNPAFGKTYRTKETHPNWASKIKNTCVENRINSGESNGMKKEDARIKSSKTRKAKMRDPEFRKVFSEGTRKAWSDGKFEGVRVGQCKWFEHTKPDGSKIKVQGTWELAFAKWADKERLEYTAHKGSIKYEDSDGVTRTYLPDFFVEDWDCWVDVKNDYHLSFQQDKFAAIHASNPNFKLKILTKDLLEGLGVNLK